MEKGTETDNALSGQTDKHIVGLDALCNLAPFTPQSEKSMANRRQKHQKPCERERDRKKEHTIPETFFGNILVKYILLYFEYYVLLTLIY